MLNALQQIKNGIKLAIEKKSVKKPEKIFLNRTKWNLYLGSKPQ